MKVDPAELQALASSLAALGPYLEDVVLVGGWAHRLFHLHPWARPREFAPLATNDVDFAVPARTPPRESTLSSLLAAAGYEARHKSIHTRPPLVRYQRADGVMIEFVADLKGSATIARGTRRTSWRSRASRQSSSASSTRSSFVPGRRPGTRSSARSGSRTRSPTCSRSSS